MAVVGSRTFTLDGVQPYLALANEEWVRPLGIGTAWTKIRIGILAAVRPNGTSNFTNAAFVFGVCSGQANPYAAASTTNFAGIAMAGSAAVTGTWTYTGVTNPYYVSGQVPLVRVGSSNTLGTGTSPSTALATTTGPIQRKHVFYLDIQKGSPNYTFSWCATQAASTDTNFTLANLIYGCEQTTFAPTIGGVGLAAGINGATVAASESAGSFDSLNIFWNQASFPFEIYGIAVSRHL